MRSARWWRTLAGLRWASREPRRCETCAHFDNDPHRIEGTFGNLAAMSSGFASVRSRDGLCRRAGLYLPAGETCPDHSEGRGRGQVPQATGSAGASICASLPPVKPSCVSGSSSTV